MIIIIYLFFLIINISHSDLLPKNKMSSLCPDSLSRRERVDSYLGYTAACRQKFDKSVLIGFIFFGVQSLTRYDGR